MIKDHTVITGDGGLTREIKTEFNNTVDEFDQKVQVVRPIYTASSFEK